MLLLRRLLAGGGLDGPRYVVASSPSPASASPPKLCDWVGAAGGGGGGVDGGGGSRSSGAGAARDVACCACCCAAWFCAWGVGPDPKRASISLARSMRGPLMRVSVTFSRRFWSASGERYVTRLPRLVAIVLRLGAREERQRRVF